VLVQEGKLACTSFPHGGMMLFDMRLCLCKRENLACSSFPHGGMMFSRCTCACARGKTSNTSFPPWWNDVVQDVFVLVLVEEGKLACTSFPHNGMVLFEMCLCLCKRES
jgi:hypothetical protein